MARFGRLRKIHWDFSAGFPFWNGPCRDTPQLIRKNVIAHLENEFQTNIFRNYFES